MDQIEPRGGARTRRVLLAVFVTMFMIATAFMTVSMVKHYSKAELVSMVPYEWQSYLMGAIERGELPDDATPDEVQAWLDTVIDGLSEKAKTSYVNPISAKRVAAADSTEAEGVWEPEPVTGTGKILVLLVEFAGTDTYRGVTYEGPMHNTIPELLPDNNVDYWQADFNTAHYEQLLFGDEGLTLKNFYEEQSGGLFTVDGVVSAWVQIEDHSEWYYGADSKINGTGSDDLNGPVWRFAADAAAAAYELYGEAIPWAEFDTDDDGWIDSLMIVNAGIDQSSSGPTWAIWAHSWFVNWPTGYTLPNGIKVGSYTTEPENQLVGVFAHEYGHQLGLPDLYDTSGAGESPVGFLDVMASGSWGPGIGPDGDMVLGAQPCHMNAWEKWVLGWENGATVYIDYDGENAIRQKVKLSQVEGTTGIRAVKVELPRQSVSLPLPTPSSGEYQWYSGYKSDVYDDMNSADFSSYVLTASSAIAVPAGGATLTFSEWYELEDSYDFGFVEVSVDGGTSWTALPGAYTTDSDMSGVNTGNGITGTTKHYVRETMDLTPFAGNALLRFRLTQDQAVYGLGWCIDDVLVTGADGTVLLEDPVTEASASLWTVTRTDESGPGWTVSTSTAGGAFRHYYIMEWRNFIGFDSTLYTSYQFLNPADPLCSTVMFWSHTPGLLIWYRNFAMGNNEAGLHPGEVALAVVDAHPQPFLGSDGHYVRQRIQLMDAAFGLRSSIPNTILWKGELMDFGPLPAQRTFDDRNAFFYSQFYKGVSEFIGVELPTYGLKATVLSEKAGLVGATIMISAAPLS